MSTPSQNPFISKLLSDKRLTKAALVDDVFDPIQEGEIKLESLLAFNQVASSFENFEQTLKDYSVDLSDIGSFEGDDDDDFLVCLNNLWSFFKLDIPENIKQSLIKFLFGKRNEKLNDLNKIQKNLESLNIQVETFGSGEDNLENFKKGNFNFIFMDFYLGAIENNTAVDAAISKMKAIYNCYTPDNKPVTLVMSTSNVAHEMEKFKTKAEIVDGIFRFSSKKDLSNEFILPFTIGVLAKEFENKHDLQIYVETLLLSAEKAMLKFKENIKKLKIEDYIFIQHLVLQGDQQPLGDYLSWLYGSHWGHLLFSDEKLQKAQKKIDRLKAYDPPLAHHQLSDTLSEIYMNSLFDSLLEDVDIHPAPAKGKVSESYNEFDPRSLYLHLGDLFGKDNSEEVWMVINAQCDLEREPSPDINIYLIPGVLKPINENISSPLRTHLFKRDNKSYRIIWETKKVKSVKYGNFYYWKLINKFTRWSRMKLPFAIEIQQAFANNLTRIGMPVPPPILESIKIEVFFCEEGRVGMPTVKIDKFKEGCAFRIATKSDIMYYFTVEFMILLKKEIVELTLKYNVNQGDRSLKMHNKLSEVLSEFDKIFLEFQYLIFNGKNKSFGKFHFDKNKKISDKSLSQSLFFVNLIDDTY